MANNGCSFTKKPTPLPPTLQNAEFCFSTFQNASPTVFYEFFEGLGNVVSFFDTATRRLMNTQCCAQVTRAEHGGFTFGERVTILKTCAVAGIVGATQS